MTRASGLTRTGTVDVLTEGTPSVPSTFEPHDHTEPSDFNAIAQSRPAETAVTDDNVPTITGDRRDNVEASPSWPDSLRPHAQSAPCDAPSLPTANEKSRPAAIDVTPVNPGT
jgi:hypothetical protein